MNNVTDLDDRKILSMRGKKNLVDPDRPYAWLVEKERSASGLIEDVGVIFLTNRECPYHCLMCDLWKNTTDFTVRKGQIAGQIKWALSRLPHIRHVKLYNSGSFFDPKAIPPGDYPEIAETLSDFETITVECHPSFINSHCLDFRNMLKGNLEVALGLETVHPGISVILNKKMSLESFIKATDFLNENDILTRAFILLKTPYMDEEEGIFWAERSIDFAFSQGIRCCSVIPVRAGNGAMEYLQQHGYYSSSHLITRKGDGVWD
jgi:radical SAM enzyme (TIGR01210 family)